MWSGTGKHVNGTKEKTARHSEGFDLLILGEIVSRRTFSVPKQVADMVRFSGQVSQSEVRDTIRSHLIRKAVTNLTPLYSLELQFYQNLSSAVS